MNVVTVMNYDWRDSNYLTMCLTWIRQAQTHLLREDACFIFSQERPHPRIRDAIAADTRFRLCVRPGLPADSNIFFPHCGSRVTGENFTYKLYVTCQLNFPFIFLDADAFVVRPLTDLGAVLEEMPAAFVDHEPDIQDHTVGFPPFINSGVFLVNDSRKTIMNWPQILAHAKQCGFLFRFKDGRRIPGTDQAAIKSYFDAIGYEYRHEKFGVHYNSCAANVVWRRDNSGWSAENAIGEPVSVVHYWGPFRPWSVFCPLYGAD